MRNFSSAPDVRYVQLTPSAIDRFVGKTRKAANGCVVWLGSKDRKGYGLFHTCARGLPLSWRAARVAYRIFIGPFPERLFVCHACDNPACVSPAHFFLGTNAENMADQVRKGRSLRGEKHGRTKLTDEEVIEIRQRIEAGESGLSVGRDFGISGTHALRIYRRTTWVHFNPNRGDR